MTEDGRTIPYDVLPELEAVIEGQWERAQRTQREVSSIIPWVFFRVQGGVAREIRDFKKAWRKACAAAGVPGAWRHDFRRTAVRNMERAGVPRSVATKITWHRTEAVYRRYAITNEQDLREGLAKVARLHERDRRAVRRKKA